ncbi:MAG: glycosyltransferase [Thermoleophilia bacterium]|nr:glycosyltransferase [Thermoleophilia bacterium]
MPQPIKFLMVGAVGYVINLAVFAGLTEAALAYAAAAAISYLLSNSVMFLGNRYWTFARRGPGLLRQYVRYLMVGLLVLASNLALLALLVELTPLDELPAQAIALLAVTPVAFLANQRWTFTDRDAPAT